MHGCTSLRSKQWRTNFLTVLLVSGRSELSCYRVWQRSILVCHLGELTVYVVHVYSALFLTGMAEHKDSVKLCEEIDG